MNTGSQHRKDPADVISQKASGKETDFERLKRAESEIRARIISFRASERLSRDELHERGASRG